VIILKDYIDVFAIYLMVLALALLTSLSPSIVVSPEISDKSRIALMLIATGFPIGYIVRMGYGSPSEFVGLKKSIRALPDILYWGIAGAIIALVLENIALKATGNLFSSILPLSQVELEQGMSVALTFIIGVSIAEEVFYNYLIFGGVYYVNRHLIGSHIISMAVFSISHIFVYGYNAPILISLSIGRLVFNEIYRRCGYLSAPMLSHLLINIIALVSAV